jgi:methionine-rich copper-binding protein CopC
MASPASVVVLTCLLLTSASFAHAQRAVSTFADLQTLVRVGDTVTVSASDGGQVTGTIAELSPSSLAILAGSERRTFNEGAVAQISQRRQDSLVNGALIGAGTGAIFAAIGNAKCSNDFGCTDSPGAFFALGIGVGAGAGLGLDAAIVKRQIIFDRPLKPRVSVGVAPFFGRERTGAAVSLAF